MNNSNDDLEALIRSASPDGHRSELIPVTITPLDGLHDTSLSEWHSPEKLINL